LCDFSDVSRHGRKVFFRLNLYIEYRTKSCTSIGCVYSRFSYVYTHGYTLKRSAPAFPLNLALFALALMVAQVMHGSMQRTAVDHAGAGGDQNRRSAGIGYSTTPTLEKSHAARVMIPTLWTGCMTFPCAGSISVASQAVCKTFPGLDRIYCGVSGGVMVYMPALAGIKM